MRENRKAVFEYADRVMSGVLYQSIVSYLPEAILDEIDDKWMDDFIRHIGEGFEENLKMPEMRDLVRHMLKRTITVGLNKAQQTYQTGENPPE